MTQLSSLHGPEVSFGTGESTSEFDSKLNNGANETHPTLPDVLAHCDIQSLSHAPQHLHFIPYRLLEWRMTACIMAIYRAHGWQVLDSVSQDNNNGNLQAFQLIVLARYLLGVPNPSPVSQHALT